MDSKNKDVKYISHFHEPLRPEDSSVSTLGCRHTNPEICKNNSLFEKCAFVRENNICLVPPRSWKRQFEKLSTNKNRD